MHWAGVVSKDPEFCDGVSKVKKRHDFQSLKDFEEMAFGTPKELPPLQCSYVLTVVLVFRLGGKISNKFVLVRKFSEQFVCRSDVSLPKKVVYSKINKGH